MKHNEVTLKVKKHGKMLCVFLLLFSSILVSAQSKTIVTGIVRSGNEALIGANVFEKGTKNGTITNVKGYFSLTVNEGAELEISYLGYESLKLKVGNQKNINIDLKESTNLLNEVVAVGYGVQKKKLITGATVQVKGDDITKLSTVNVLGALQSQTPGVNIIKQSGKPGDGFKVTVRGLGTIGNSNPLYIIDGVPNGDINLLNPNDIESIDVLKDAASSAIYGARASNGVILITTKQGKKGKASIQYDSYWGWQNIAKKTAVLNAKQYLSVLDQAGYNRAYFDSNVPSDILAKVDNGEFTGTNWLDEMTLKNAPMQNQSLNIMSGNELSRYSFGFSYTSQSPIIGLKNSDVKSEYERYTARMNSDHDLIKSNGLTLLQFGETFTMGYVNSSGLGMGTGSIYWNDIRNALAGNPLLPVYNADGTYHTPLAGLDYESTNPLAEMDILRSRVNSKNYSARGSFYLTLQPIRNLKFKTNFGYAYNGWSSRQYIPVYSLSTVNFSTLDNVSQGAGNGLQWSWDNTLNYDFTLFNNHKFNALVGNSVEKWGLGEDISGTNKGSNFDSFEYAYLSNVNSITNVSLSGAPWGQGGIESFFGRLNYDYKGRYMASAVMRADGSSNFARGHRWGYFPSFSAGWNITEEPFFENLKSFTDQLKLRASWGENGNCNIPNFRYLSSIANGNASNAAEYYFGTSQSTPTYGSYADLIANPNLKWETSRQVDLGLDSRFLNNRLGFSFDWYQKKTMDWLVQPTGLAIWGTGSPYVNGGDVMNSGVETLLTWDDKIGDFTYGIHGNVTYNQNKVLSINNKDGYIDGVSGILSPNTSYLYRAQVGYPIGYFVGYKTDGIFQNQAEIDHYVDANGNKIMSSAKPGDVKFLDLNKNGIIDEGDKTMIGDPHPDVTYGVTLSLGYKGFDLSVTGYGVAGNQIAKSYRNWTNKPFNNYTTDILGAWNGEGTSNRIPAVNGSSINYGYISDLYIENGDYFRITNITLGYDLKKTFKSLPVSQLRFYGTVQNAFTFTKYSGMDPEVGYNAGESWASGIDLGYYPSARSFMVGCNIKF
ncbi:MAG: TonB-dependent receptor [Bacteroidota bacterium]|nr:TonB-dependent receptor [Bacteroidota bacterium]